MKDRNTEHGMYVMGFVLSVILTAIPFAVVWSGALAGLRAGVVIGVCALAQLIVHGRFFLHLDLSKQKREDLDLVLFTVLLLVILVGGTIWVLTDLHHRMH